jgi:hypothetical protein
MINFEDENIPKVTPTCCDVWSKLIKSFFWYYFVNYPEYRAMPCIPDTDGYKWRVNYCPSCGQNVRDCVIKEDD